MVVSHVCVCVCVEVDRYCGLTCVCLCEVDRYGGLPCLCLCGGRQVLWSPMSVSV